MSQIKSDANIVLKLTENMNIIISGNIDKTIEKATKTNLTGNLKLIQLTETNDDLKGQLNEVFVRDLNNLISIAGEFEKMDNTILKGSK